MQLYYTILISASKLPSFFALLSMGLLTLIGLLIILIGYSVFIKSILFSQKLKFSVFEIC
jgi:hypothetical protein